MNCRYVARSFAMIGARSGRYFVAFCLTASPLARRRANPQNSNLPPPILTTSPVTAALRVAGIETSRTESPIEEPTPESNDLAMSRLRIRETIIDQSLRWPSSFTRRVCSKKKELLYCCTQQYSCNSPRILGAHWVHTLGHLEIDKPPS